MAYELPVSVMQDFVSSVVDNSRDGNGTVYATVVSNDEEEVMIQIDGSDALTPATPLTGTSAGDRVIVMFKNRNCLIIGNASSPSITTSGSIRYSELPDKPSIEEVTLVGDKSFEDLGLGRITNTELEEMLTL